MTSPPPSIPVGMSEGPGLPDTTCPACGCNEDKFAVGCMCSGGQTDDRAWDCGCADHTLAEIEDGSLVVVEAAADRSRRLEEALIEARRQFEIGRHVMTSHGQAEHCRRNCAAIDAALAPTGHPETHDG